jgi:hypothetical protein
VADTLENLSIPIRAIRVAPARLEKTGLREAARLASSLVLVLLSMYAVAYVARVSGLLEYPFDLDQGEGYDVNSGLRLSQGLGIYNSNEDWPYFSSNYPPVFSLLLVPFLNLMGPTLAAGRILSAVAAILTAALICVAVLRERGTMLGAGVAGLLYLSSPYVFHTTPLARVNALTELFSLAGLILCLSRPRFAFLAGVMLLGVAIFTKPTALPLLLLVLGYGLFTRPSIAIPISVMAGVGGLLILGVIERLSGGAFWLNTVQGNVNPWALEQATAYWTNFSLIHAGMLVMVLLTLRSRPGARYWLYVLASFPIVIGVGKWGAGESYFLGLIVALCILVGCSLSFLATRPATLLTASLVLVAQVGLFVHEPLSAHLGMLGDLGLQSSALGTTPRGADAQAGWEILRLLDKNPGPALIEDPSYALVSGREVVGNPTHLRNLHESGQWQGEELLNDLEARKFSWVVLDAQLYPEPVLQTIGRTYYLYHVVRHRGVDQWIFAPGADSAGAEKSP